MKERQSAALAASGICLSAALLRMLAPDMPFDWMTLLLVLGAAAALLACGRYGRPHGPGPRRWGLRAPGGAALAPGQLEALGAKVERAGWPSREGGVYDALAALGEERPFAAMCAARGMLLTVMRQTPPDGEDAEAMSPLIDALDAVAACGEDAAEPRAVGALLKWTLLAIGRLEG